MSQLNPKFKHALTKYVYPKLKFGIGSAISTTLDYGVFFILLQFTNLPVALVQGVAQSCGMITNFLIQRNFIFSKERTITSSIIWSISFSLLSIVLASLMVHYLYMVPFFLEHPIFMKIGVSALFFFFNFYTKQFAFEKKIKW
ncbi:MAG: GtrA family protein [Balneola sp.]